MSFNSLNARTCFLEWNYYVQLRVKALVVMWWQWRWLETSTKTSLARRRELERRMNTWWWIVKWKRRRLSQELCSVLLYNILHIPTPGPQAILIFSIWEIKNFKNESSSLAKKYHSKMPTIRQTTDVIMWKFRRKFSFGTGHKAEWKKFNYPQNCVEKLIFLECEKSSLLF